MTDSDFPHCKTAQDNISIFFPPPSHNLSPSHIEGTVFNLNGLQWTQPVLKYTEGKGRKINCRILNLGILFSLMQWWFMWTDHMRSLTIRKLKTFFFSAWLWPQQWWESFYKIYQVLWRKGSKWQSRHSCCRISWTMLGELIWATAHIKNILNANASKQIFTWNRTIDYINKQINMNVWWQLLISAECR